MRKLIKANGEELDIDGPRSIRDIANMIGAELIDTVLLTDRTHVMIVDDSGLIDGKPRNEKATQHYHERCGGPNDHYIAGDVVIVPDSDFAEI